MKPRTKIISVLLSIIMLLSAFTIIPVQFSANDIDAAQTGADADIGATGGMPYIYKLVDSVTPGNNYLIVSSNTKGYAYALHNDGGSANGTSLNKTEVYIRYNDLDSDGIDDYYIYIPPESKYRDILWTATSNEEGFNLSNDTDYLEGKSGKVSVYDQLNYPDRCFTYDDQQLKHIGGNYSYTVYFDGSNFTSSYNDCDEVIYVYEKTAAAELDFDWSTPDESTPDQPGSIGNYVFKYVETVTPGNDYLIVNSNEVGEAWVIKNNGGTSDGTVMADTEVTIASGDIDNDGNSDLYIDKADANTIWTASANGEGFNLTNGSDYLESKRGGVKIFDTQQYPERYWTYIGQQLQHLGSQNTYTLYDDDGFTSTYYSTDKVVYVFEKTDVASGISTTQPTTQPVTQIPSSTTAPASGEAVNVGFTSDVHDCTDELRSWINYVQANVDPDLDAMAYCGDYSYIFNRSSHVASFNEIVDITNELVGENKGCYTTGNHEWMNASGIVEEIQDTPNFKIVGELRKTDAYTIYAMGASQQSDGYTEENIEALDQYLANTYTDRPVFIITHFPLHHYSSRTTKNADMVIDVLNQYPNAVWLWGHNHSMSDPLYGEILTAGDSINYASGKSKDINFTYLAAGGMYRESQVKNNSGLVATISGDDVKSVTFQYHRSSNGDKVGGPITVYMDGSDPSDPPSVPPSVPPTPVTQPKEYVFKLTDTMKNGGEYLIVNTNAAGSGYSLKNNGGTSDGTSLASDSVLIQKSDLNNDGVQDTYIKHGTTDTVWLATANEGGFNLTNNDDYLDAKSGNIKIFDEQRYDDRYWTYSASQLKYVGISTTYTLYFSSSSFTSSTSSNNSGKIYIYEKICVEDMPIEVMPTEALPIFQGEDTNIGITADVHGNTNELENWLTSVQTAYEPDLDAMVYCGDYSFVTNSTSDYVNEFKEVVSITDRIAGSGKGIYTSGEHEYYTNGEQSKLNGDFTNTDGFVRIGESKIADNYRIFCFGAAGWLNATGAYPEEDIQALKDYLDSAPTDVPIFIAAHFPLHTYSNRTITNADKVIDVLNDHPNAIFLWGHNHTNGDSHYGEFKTAGDSITYASGKEKEINFTYLSSGSMYSESQTEYAGLVATVSESGDNVTFRYFRSSDGTQIGEDTSVTIKVIVYKLVETVTPGKEYLIVNSDNSGSAYALKNDGGTVEGTSMDSAPVTVYPGKHIALEEFERYISEASSDIIWTASANEDGFTLTNGDDYLEGKSGKISIFESQRYPSRYWTYENSQLVFINPDGGNNAVNYTLYFSSDAEKFTQSTSSNYNRIYLYEKTVAELYQPYIIEYDACDVQGVFYRQEVPEDGKAVLLNAPTREGYHFITWTTGGWSPDLPDTGFAAGTTVDYENFVEYSFFFNYADKNRVIHVYAVWEPVIAVPLDKEIVEWLEFDDNYCFQFTAEEDDYYLIRTSHNIYDYSSGSELSKSDYSVIKYLKKGESYQQSVSFHPCKGRFIMHVTKTPIRSMTVEATNHCYQEDKTYSLFTLNEFNPIISLYNKNHERVFRGTSEELGQMLNMWITSNDLRAKEPGKYYMPVSLSGGDIKCQMKCFVLRDRNDSTLNYEPLPIRGDADGDGEISAIDVTYIQRYDAMFDVPISFDVLIYGDVDGSGDLEILDATYLQRWMAEMTVPLAVGEPIPYPE